MVKAICRDYGFNCEFISEGDLDTVIDEFGKHCTEKHGIEYPAGNTNQIFDKQITV